MSTPIWVQKIRKMINHEAIMVVGVNAVIIDESGRVLLQRRTDNGRWGLPGGLLEMEESLLDAVKRETREEVGIDIDIIRLTGLYSRQPIYAYPNGDQVCGITAVFRCAYVSGELTCEDGESTEAAFFSLDHLPEGLETKFIQRIQDAVATQETVVI